MICLASAAAEARVFSFKDAAPAAYVRGTGAMSGVARKPFGDAAGTDTEIAGETKYAYSGEIGAAIPIGTNLTLRLGAEIIQHHPLSDQAGNSPAGVKRFDMDSSVFVFNPSATAEYLFGQSAASRYYALFGAGYAQVTVENAYRLTAPGRAQLGVTDDFTEKLEGTGISYVFGFGMETMFTDNATVSADLGYRYLPISKLTYKGDVKNFVEPGGVAKGDPATNMDGSGRKLDLGGVFVGVTFRFYMNFL